MQLSQHYFRELDTFIIPSMTGPRYHVGHVAKNRQKLIIFSQNVLKCSCNTELIPEKLASCSIDELFSAEKLENNANLLAVLFSEK